jgi:hypothetical protein
MRSGRRLNRRLEGRRHFKWESYGLLPRLQLVKSILLMVRSSKMRLRDMGLDRYQSGFIFACNLMKESVASCLRSQPVDATLPQEHLMWAICK